MFGRAKYLKSIAGLYSHLVDQARQPVFYAMLCVPDTIEGRLELVMLHCYLVLRRLKSINDRAAARLGQELLEYMFGDLDRSIREIGVGDMSVGKYMKRLGKSFYGRADAYDKALDTHDLRDLQEALLRNVFATSDIMEPLDDCVRALGNYVTAADKTLSTITLADIQNHEFVFALPIERQAA